MEIHWKKIGKKNNSPNINEMVKKRETRIQCVTLLTEFLAEWHLQRADCSIDRRKSRAEISRVQLESFCFEGNL